MDYSNLFQKSALPICLECLGTETKNRTGVEEKLSSCSACGTCVHLSCVPSGRGPELAVLINLGSQWTCEECCTCEGCKQSKEQVSSHPTELFNFFICHKCLYPFLFLSAAMNELLK